MLAKQTPRTLATSPGTGIAPEPVITWEKLPADFILPDDPVDNINQPPIAAALTESLVLAGLLPEDAIVCTDYGIIATVDGTTIPKAPDWAYIPNIIVPRTEIEMSYTPHLHGETPTIVIEILSKTDGGEYSTRRTRPMGKWYFYEIILKVPYYGIFEPKSGDFQVYKLNASGRYDRLPIEESGRYWIEPMQLSIAAWKGDRENRKGYWLRWWNGEGELLLWGNERIKQAQQEIKRVESRVEIAESQAQAERDRADTEKARADRLAQKLQELGLDLE